MKISVSILKEKDNFKEVVNKLQNTSADYIHLDIQDKSYTDYDSFELKEFNNLSSKPYDVHIMSTNLDYQINEAIKIKPEIITFNYECTKYISKYINIIKQNNIKVGLAINPKTKLYKIKKYLKEIDVLLILSVNPGLGGQLFINKTIKKIKKASKLKGNFLISVDGGINDTIIKEIKDYIDIAVSGSFITDSDNYEDKIMLLKK